MLKYFSKDEFRGQYDMIDPDLLQVIDKFRELWGAPVSVSNSDYAIGRTYGSGFHNYVKHGNIKAIDLIPSGMKTKKDMRRAYECALNAGAKGIGLYPEWHQGPGIHIDVGERPGGKVGLWSAFPTGENGKQEYYSIDKALGD